MGELGCKVSRVLAGCGSSVISKEGPDHRHMSVMLIPWNSLLQEELEMEDTG